MPSDDFWADLPENRSKRTPPTKESAAGTGAASEPGPRRPLFWRRAAWVTVTFVLMAAAGGAGITLALWQGTAWAASDEPATEPIVFEIPRGRSTADIAADLETSGAIVSRWPFLFEVALRDYRPRAGTYNLSPADSIRAIARQLAGGEVTAHRVTIPEGWRIEQIADRLAELKVVTREDFLTASVYDPVRYTLPPGIGREAGATLEGLLFPDTYEFRIGVTSKEIIETLLTNFTTKTQELAPNYEQIVLASIVEREAKRAQERPLIAGVYQNRLDNNLKLEADPTVQYGNDNLRVAMLAAGELLTWWEPITAADYQAVKSPWNTYLILGLPPAPIANPGLASLEAAVHPADHDFYYFFHRADGTAVFSKTKTEHDAAKARE